ncbi:MAG: succinate dehydrogenase, cytochrome b556 subunit [Gammaproteobacteria bacterium]|nr:succinate dehydrogenase, cytochrome b556 subunit [Gammaproteobacteria bacterium]
MDLQRPVFLKLSQIHFPAMALVSILHRVAGVILAIAMPLVVYFLSISLESRDSYQQLLNHLLTIPIKLLLVLVLWAFGHHVFAGFRLLLIDFYARPVQGRDSARVVLILSALSLVLAAWVVLL